MSDSRKMLASHDGFGCVYECSCGTIHVAVGPVDLKFTRASLLETYAMLAEAIQQLKPPSDESGQADDLIVGGSPLYAN